MDDNKRHIIKGGRNGIEPVLYSHAPSVEALSSSMSMKNQGEVSWPVPGRALKRNGGADCGTLTTDE